MTTLYYITCADSDPHNHSCKRFIIDSQYNWICGNGEGSDQWDELIHKNDGYENTCQYLLDTLHRVVPREDWDFGISVDGCWISTVTEEDMETLFPDYGVI